MDRFIAFAWDVKDLQAAQTAHRQIECFRQARPQWVPATNAPGLAVFCLPFNPGSLRVHVLPNDSGVILGTLFHRPRNSAGSSSVVTTVPENLAAKIIDTSGQHLNETVWGSYIAFLSDPSHRRHTVIRDCSAKIPCFRTRIDSLSVFFSQLDDLLVLELPTLTVNWQYIAAYLYFDDLRVRSTALNEVGEILAGECVDLSPSGERQFPLWDPNAIYHRGRIDNYSEAQEQLRHVAEDCIGAWASTYDTILLSLSGGLDSAIVLGCLQRLERRPHTFCFNRYTAKPGEDERGYARAAAQRANLELVESEWCEGQTPLDERILRVPRLTKPTATFISLLDLTFRNDLARKHGAQSTWTGQGGDHLFSQNKVPLFALDYVHDHPFGWRVPFVVDEAARLSRKSYRSVWRQMWRWRQRRQLDRPQNQNHDQMSFLRPEAVPSNITELLANPWEDAANDLPPAKQRQIHSYADLLGRPMPPAGLEVAPEQHPLISQPLLEVCLQIPSYLALKGGRQRSLARHTFRDVLPQNIYERESKGSTRSHNSNIVRDHLPFLRELLLDGQLVRQKLVDPAALEAHLVEEQPLRPLQTFPLLSCVAAEIFLHGLTDVTRTVIARETHPCVSRDHASIGY